MSKFKTVLRHSSYIFGFKVLSRLIYIVFVVVAASRLGPELFGVFAFSMAMVELFSWLGDIGITRYGARELVRHWDDRRLLSGQILALQVSTSVVLGAAGLAGILLWHPPEPKMQLLLMGLVAILLSGVVNATESIFIASQNFFYSSLLAFVGRLIFVGTGLVVLLAGASVIAVMTGFIAGVIIESILRLLVISAKVSRFSFRFPAGKLKDMLLASMPFAVAAVASVIFSQIGVVALELLRGDAAVGVFTISYSLFGPFVWASIVISKATFPGITEIYKRDVDGARLYIWQWLRLMIMAGVPIAIFFNFLAGPALSYFPAGYEDTTGVLMVMMWQLPLTMIFAIELNVMQITGSEKAVARLLVVSMVATTAAAFILIPVFGIKGAAMGMVVGALVREIQAYHVIRRKFMERHYLKLVLWPLSGGLVMIAVSLLIWPFNSWLAAFAGLAVYIAAMFVTGAIRPRELKMLARG